MYIHKGKNSALYVGYIFHPIDIICRIINEFVEKITQHFLYLYLSMFHYEPKVSLFN